MRKQKLALRSAFGLSGYKAYEYTRGFNFVGLFCVVAGVFLSLAIDNPLTGVIHIQGLFYLTPTGCSLVGTALLYGGLSCIPPIHRYILRDRHEVSI